MQKKYCRKIKQRFGAFSRLIRIKANYISLIKKNILFLCYPTYFSQNRNVVDELNTYSLNLNDDSVEFWNQSYRIFLLSYDKYIIIKVTKGGTRGAKQQVGLCDSSLKSIVILYSTEFTFLQLT